MNTSTSENTAGKMPALPGSPVHIMIDLETLGTAPGSVILSIGACVFDENGPSENPKHWFHVHLDAGDLVKEGFVTDVGTVLWWLDQSAEARKAVLDGQKKGRYPGAALTEFVDFLDLVAPEVKSRMIWGKGPSFDCGLLAALCRALRSGSSMPVPWRYSNERCVRTVAAMRPDIAEPVREGVHHTALDDALHHARHVGAVMKALALTVSAGGPPAVSEVSRGGAEFSGAVGAALEVVDFVNGVPSLDKMPKGAVSILRPLTRGGGEGALFNTAAFILAAGVRCYRRELDALREAHDLLRISHDAKAHNYEVQKERADKAEAAKERLRMVLCDIRDYGCPEGDGDPSFGNDRREIYQLVVDAIGEWKADDKAGGDARAPAGGEDASEREDV